MGDFLYEEIMIGLGVFTLTCLIIAIVLGSRSKKHITWMDEMGMGKSMVVVQITGGIHVKSITKSAEGLGYKLENMSQSRSSSGLFTNYTLIFRKVKE